MRPRIVLMVGLLATCAPAGAQTLAPSPSSPARPLAIAGAGSVTCPVWAAEPANGAEHIAHQQWLVGFVSGYNAFVADGASVPPGSDGIVGWVDHCFCPASPDQTLAQAGISLVEFTREQANYKRLWPPFPPVRYSP